MLKVTNVRRKFDPKNKQDMEDFKYFVVNNKWNGYCPFELEWPYNSIPDMIKDMIIKQYVFKLDKNTELV